MEQQVYAKWLEAGTRIGLALLVVTFALYVFGVFEPLVAPQEVTRLWTLSLDQYLAATGAPSGWSWLDVLGKSDYFNLIGIAILALVTVVCYARMVPALLARGERLQAALAIAQVLVLLAAASGVLSGGH